MHAKTPVVTLKYATHLVLFSGIAASKIKLPIASENPAHTYPPNALIITR